MGRAIWQAYGLLQWNQLDHGDLVEDSWKNKTLASLTLFPSNYFLFLLFGKKQRETKMQGRLQIESIQISPLENKEQWKGEGRRSGGLDGKQSTQLLTVNSFQFLYLNFSFSHLQDQSHCRISVISVLVFLYVFRLFLLFSFCH